MKLNNLSADRDFVVGRTTKLPDLDIATTPEIHRWLTKIEDGLSDVCTIIREATSKLNSEQKQKISALCTNVLGASSHMALNYQMIKQKYISANTEIEVMYNDNVRDNVIANHFEDIKKCVKAATSAATPAHASYSGMVKKGNCSVICPPSTANIAIYPENKEQQSEQTKKIVQEIIKPDKLKLHIRGVWNTKNGGVIISSEQKKDIEKLKKSEQLIKSGLKVEETTKRRPKMIILGVPSDITESDLYEYLYEQNIAEKETSIDLVDSIRAKVGRVYSYRVVHKDTESTNVPMSSDVTERSTFRAGTQIVNNCTKNTRRPVTTLWVRNYFNLSTATAPISGKYSPFNGFQAI
ncbi:hypothetical protein NE865_01613 [Phthorimaea operculella]|nr:hypothetical protein NE865_01613 [Phthorimaea operculella]